jgi:hypothetical protein
MLATTPHLASVPILLERAQRGVKVKIILAAPHIVSQLRGETMQETAKEAILGWTAHAANCPNMEVRVTQTLADTYLATCMLVDGRHLRFDVYDPHRQRSLQGEMIEIQSPDGLDFNMIRMFRSQFEEAWLRAMPLNCLPYSWWLLKRNWNWWMGLIFMVAAFATSNVVLIGIFGSASATFFTNGMVEMARAKWTVLR